MIRQGYEIRGNKLMQEVFNPRRNQLSHEIICLHT